MAMRKAAKDRVDKISEAVALMERGEFEFPDGKERWCNINGKREHRIVKREDLVYAGYAPESQMIWAKVWGEKGDWHKYYRERLAWHRQRLSGGYRQALAELTDGGGALRNLSKQAYEAIMYKLADPEKASKEFSLKDLTAVYLGTTKLEASIGGEANTRRGGVKELPDVNVVNVISTSLPEDYAKRIADKQQDYIEAEVVEDAL
jgi:hypothetical protein